jgi:hypothetical protein
MSCQNNICVLKALRNEIHFLNFIPNDIYFSLDSSSFYFPTPAVQKKREELEQRTGQYVMTYKRDVFSLDIPVQAHLCAHLKGAQLSLTDLVLLTQYEKSVFPDVSLVVYKKPLQIQNYFKSKLYFLYKEKNKS